MSCGEQCLSVFLHEGKPNGSYSDLDGIRSYVAQPSSGVAKSEKAILIFPDVYGVGLRNTQLIADRLAKDVNVPTYLIDLFSGDQAPEPGTQPDFSFPKWLERHGPEKTIPIIQKVLNHLRSQGTNQFAALGYCFGGKYVFHTAQVNEIKVGSVCHPSFLKNPEDIQKLLDTSKAPILVNSGEHDQQYPIEFQKVTDGILGNGKYKPGYKRTYYPGATHGFGCRADLSKPADKTAFDESFKETVNWFKAHL